MDDRDPRAEGLNARLRGLTDDDNPYDPKADPEAYRLWNAGWDTEEPGDDGDD